MVTRLDLPLIQMSHTHTSTHCMARDGCIMVHTVLRPLPCEGRGQVTGGRGFTRTRGQEAEMAEYDLSSKIGGYLDRHLVLPMLEFLSEKDVSSCSL